MNYNLLNYIDNGIIIEDIQKEEIFFINDKAKLLLKTKQIKGILKFSQFFSNSVVYKDLKQEIQSSLNSSSKFECTVYFRCFDGTFLEVKLYCDWFQKDKNLIGYMFKSAVEVAGENNISFKELAEQLPSGIIVMNVENGLSITYANNEHYKILGIPHNSNQEKTYLLKDFVFEEDVHWVLSETYLNLSKNEDVDIEFRMKTKDNVIKWVRLFGRASISDTGEKLFYSSIKDLSHRRSINDKLHLERVMFYKITELTNEVLFRLDLQTHMIYFLGSNQNVFGSATVYENYPHTLKALKKVHPDDDLAHQDLVYCLENGIEKEIDIRYLVDQNTNLYEWFRISYSFIKNNDGSLISAIGKMSNINTQKLLEERAKMDLLTGFYNKLTTEQEIKHLISNKHQDSFVLFIIDIDNFKSINDNLGHHFGDMVLVGIAEDIKSCFKETDILGRIGGDEFLVVMKNVDDKSEILKKADELCNLLDKSFSGGTKVNYKISASIGISMYPNDGDTFEKLYQKSDIALYKIKDSNKNGYKIYLEEPDDSNNLKYIPKKIRKKDTTFSSILINNDIISTVVNLLYESKDIEATIFLILEYIGNMFKVDRCYIFETDDYGKTYNDTYDWCKNKKTNFTKNISISNITNLIKSADDEGLFYTNDIHSLQDVWVKDILLKAGVKSIFLIDSKRKYNEKGVLFIEDCSTKRTWSDDDIFTLMQVSKIIFNTLNKHNIIKNLNNKSNKSINYLSDSSNNNNNSVTHKDDLINPSKLADIINQYYISNDTHIASTTLIQNIANLLQIDKVTSIAYNKNTTSYVKYFSYTLDTNFNDFSQVSIQQYKDCMDILNPNQDENILYLLSILNANNYLYINDYHANKDKLDKIGFTPINTENVEEVFIFLTKHESFTGYIAFERYSNTKLYDNELDILISLCQILNMGIAKQNLTQKYEMELLIKDIILNNEETPVAVVEKYTFKILYHNDFYYSVFPNIAVGGICYELLGRTEQCEECCFNKDLLMNDANQCDHQWIKKAVPYTLENGKEVYVIYSKDSIDYIKKINAVDNLTQALLFRGLEEYYEKFIKVNDHNYALCSLDIDKFKYINEIFDYNTGDKILRKVANVIKNFIDADENFCRIDGDKFAILLRYNDEIDLHIRMKSLSNKFEDMKNEHFPETRINISAGLTTVNREISLTKLLNQSIIARKNSKGSHKNNFSYYNPEIDIKIKNELQIEEKIPRAIENDEFVPYIQPKFNIYTKKICGAEALVRWKLADGTMIFPDQFIPLFEKNGFICQLDFIVYEKVMKHIRKCLDNGFNVYPISVNVSRNHIANKNFLNEFMTLVGKYNIPREYIELEITESIFVEDIQELKNFVSGMKGYKLKVSIDDFGSAYSSLQNLTDIEVDILKIDKGFLNNIDMSESVITKDEILLRNIINLAKELDFHVICEGIESDDQIELLKKVGCEYGQGYVFARPMPIEDYEKQFLQC